MPLLALWDWSPASQLDLWIACWTITAGILSSATCAVLGCYLLLRRLSLLGDAISHAVLPGTVLAVLWSGSLDGWPVFVGAVLTGLLSAFLTQALAHWGNVAEDSSMGVVFTSLFAFGVVLITQFASMVDLDPGCVLYGLIEFVTLNTVLIGGVEVPRAVLTLGGVAILTALFQAVFWKELKIVAFDPALASAMGLSAVVLHYLLMGMVALVTVASFEAVGSILVIAMLIVPPATAQLLTDRFGTMFLWSIAVSVVASIGGYWAAWQWNTSVSGMMAVVAGGCFGLAVLFAPKHGILGRVLRNWGWSLRIAQEDILAALYRLEESRGISRAGVTWNDCLVFSGSARWGSLAVWLLGRKQLVVADASGAPQLSDQGRTRAMSLVRSHRLWEAYLEKHFDLPRDHLHEPASRVEHYLTPELQAELADEVSTQTDPHGRQIPSEIAPRISTRTPTDK